MAKITERDKRYYRMGFEQGEHKLRETMQLLQKTNKCLWRELLRLDKYVPVTGVLLTYSQVERLVRALRKGKASPYRATVLEKKIKKAKLEEELSSYLNE